MLISYIVRPGESNQLFLNHDGQDHPLHFKLMSVNFYLIFLKKNQRSPEPAVLLYMGKK